MKAALSLALLQAIAVSAIRIIQSNDDGWADSNIRAFNDALNKAGHDVVLSAPADNQSGKSKSTYTSDHQSISLHSSQVLWILNPRIARRHASMIAVPPTVALSALTLLALTSTGSTLTQSRRSGTASTCLVPRCGTARSQSWP